MTQDQYAPEEVDACKSVLIELIHVLGEFNDDVAVVGGWVPSLLIPDSTEKHVGTLDVDLALDFKKISTDTYKTLLKALTDHGYEQSTKQPFVFHRVFMLEGKKVSVQVDLLSGEYGGTGKSHRTQEIQDVRARKARGCDLVFDQSVLVEVDGRLPSGAINTVKFKIAGIVPFLVMKGRALADRIKEKMLTMLTL